MFTQRKAFACGGIALFLALCAFIYWFNPTLQPELVRLTLDDFDQTKLSSKYIACKGNVEFNELSDIIESLGTSSCTLKSNENYLWLMFMGDSNTRETVKTLFESIEGLHDDVFVEIESINDAVEIKMEHLKQTLFGNESIQTVEEQNLIHLFQKYKFDPSITDHRWTDKEWIIKVLNRRNSNLIYYIRVSTRFLMNFNRLGQPALEKLKWIQQDFNSHVGIFNMSLLDEDRIKRERIPFLFVDKMYPDILYFSHGLWNIHQLQESHFQMSQILHHWKYHFGVDPIYWVTNYPINHPNHPYITNEIVRNDYVQTQKYAKAINISLFDIYSMVAPNISKHVPANDVHYKSLIQSEYRQFIAHTTSQKLCCRES